MSDLYSSDLKYDGRTISPENLIESCDTSKINKLQMELAKIKEISYVYYPEQGKVAVDVLKFLLSYRSFFREIYCGFGCPVRQNCDIRSQFGVNESFSLDYVLNNFPVNYGEGTKLDGTIDNYLKNAIELYISSRKQHISEHEWIWGKLSDNEKEEFLLIQKEILDEYTPVLEKGIEKLVLEESLKNELNLNR